MSDHKPKTIYRKDYREPDYWIPNTELFFDLEDKKTIVRSKLAVEKNGSHDRPLELSGQELKLNWIKVNSEDIIKLLGFASIVDLSNPDFLIFPENYNPCDIIAVV